MTDIYSPTLGSYMKKLMDSFAAREMGNVELEDDLLGDLDELWLSMEPRERELSKGFAQHAYLAFETAKKVKESQVHSVSKPPRARRSSFFIERIYSASHNAAGTTEFNECFEMVLKSPAHYTRGSSSSRPALCELVAAGT